LSDITVGDLVVVVRPLSCGCTHAIGFPFTVLEIRRAGATCTNCHIYGETLLARCDEDGWFDVSALKKIDPLAEAEPVEEEALA